jgi:hypothetical protein
MKVLTYLICSFFVLGNLGVSAQEAGEGVLLTHYIFDKFQAGKVFFKTGLTQEVELNYNTLTSEMVFNDGGKYLAMGESEKVDSVVIAGRVFVPGDKKFYELLARTSSPLFAEYTSTIKEEGSNLGYGMTSTTTASTPLKSLIQNGGAYNLKLPDGFQILSKHSYLIFSGGGYRRVGNARQLSNLFPAKKEFINHWIKGHHTNFSNNNDMIELVQAIDKN